MHPLRRLAACSLLILWLAADSHGADLLVATPAEFAAVVPRAKPGDRIVLKNGTWKDADLVFTGEGQDGQPITLAAETPGHVVIAGKSRVAVGGKHLVVSGLLFRGAWHADEVLAFRADSQRPAADCRVTDCAFIDCNPPDPADDTKYVSIYGQRNRIDHCRLEGKRSRGTTLVVWLGADAAAGPAGHQIDHNHFGPRPELKKNGGETIRVGDSKTSLTVARVVVEWNLFEECNGEAEVISNKSCENIYRYNTFRRCAGALTLRHGRRCLVEGNWFFGEQAAKTGGIRVIGPDHRIINNYLSELTGDGPRSALSLMAGVPETPLNGYEQVARAQVLHNTIIDCKHPLVIGLKDKDADTRLPPTDCVLANNLVSGRVGPLVASPTPGVGLKWLANLFHGAEVGDADAAKSGIVGDPQLARGEDGLWRPGAQSPALGAARGDFAVVEDIDGQPRGAKADVGCDAASTAEIRRRATNASDVGPTWGRGT